MQSDTVVEGKVRMIELKKFALEKLPEGPLRDDILSQPEEISPGEYLANCRVWMRLARLHG
jgi:hypothetical protein